VEALSVADEALVRRLWDEHAGPLLGYVSRLLDGDRGRAEDVVQEVLLRAWQHPDALDPARPGGASVRGWMYTVARNIVVDGQRAKSARPREVALPASVNDVPAPASASAVDRVIDEMQVTDALRSLSRDHRTVIEHLYFRDQSIASTAVALGIPEGTVKSRAFYALRALRAACRDNGVQW
jgi:RNA polymerase sigma-70 factor, ECF subfamily